MKTTVSALGVFFTVFFAACGFFDNCDPTEIHINSVRDAEKKLANYTFAGDSPYSPVYLKVNMNLGDLSQPGNNYLRLLEVIGNSGLYAELSLSGSKTGKTKVFTSPPLDKAAKGMDKIVEIDLPADITSITADKNGNSPFFFYENLVSVDRGGWEGFTKIGDFAFSFCKNLKRVDTSFAKTLGKEAFRGCENITHIYFGSLETIGDKAFFDCGALEKITMRRIKPPNLGEGVFLGNTPSTFTLSIEKEYEELYRAWLAENASKFNNNGAGIVIELLE